MVTVVVEVYEVVVGCPAGVWLGTVVVSSYTVVVLGCTTGLAVVVAAVVSEAASPLTTRQL